MASALERLRKARQGSGTSLASANITSGTTGTLSSGSSALARLRAARSKQTQPTLTPAAQRYAVNNTSSAALKNGPSGTPVPTGEGSKNRGGLLGGLGYFTEKVTLGTVQGIEGIFDFLIGGASDILGELGVAKADKFAERQFANDWLNYSHADEWYNPGEGWKVAGDVGGGIGSSAPGIATAAVITYFSGGAAAPIAAALVSGTSAAGTATKEAYQETGKLTGKEWGYGVLSGATEAGIEYATAGLGAGAGAIGKKIGQAFGKTAAKEVGKTTVKTVAVDLGKNFLSEAFEEGFSELMAPQYKKITYDPNAKNATAGEIAYAALVGGLSGILTSGAGTTVTQGVNIRKGAKAETSGSVDRIKAISEVVLEASGGKTDVQSVNAVRELYHDLTEGKLKITEGVKLNVKQKRALGELQTANMAAIFEPKMAEAAGNAVKNAEAVAERLNTYGNIKMADGKFSVISDMDQFKRDNPGVEVRDITADDIRAKFDTKNGKQALTKAIRDNDLLRYVAASDVAGRLIMSVEQFENTALEGTTIKDQVALNRFIEEASPEKRRALGAELGIAENEWDTLQLGRLNEAVRSYRESGKAEAYQSRLEAVNKAKSVDESAAKKKIPSAIRLGDGKVERYKTDKVDIAVYREGDSFTVYDYNENAPSRALSRAEVNNVLEQMRSVGEVNIPTVDTTANVEAVSGQEGISPAARMSKETVGSVVENVQTETPVATNDATDKVAALREKIDAKKIESYARENIADYDSLSTANQSMIRKVIREGRAHGLSETDVLSYAKVAAHTGLNIEYDANMKDGDAGYYDPKANKIVVNPKAEKKQELILIHELDHAVRKLVDLGGNVRTLVYEGAEKGLSNETWERIKKDYAEQDVDVTREELLADEASAYYTEAILGGKITVDMLLEDNSSLKKKILNFFSSAARAYSKDEKLSRAARRHYKSFKAMFDAFAKANQGRNSATAVAREEVIGKSEEVGKSARRSSDFEATLRTMGDYSVETDADTVISDIEKQNETALFFPKGLSKDFIKAVRRSNGFAPPRLYRGMEAAELDYIIENGFIKSNSSYNFHYQQGETRFSPNIQTARAYATSFAPAGIREKFFEQGMPSYIVEVGNYYDLNFVNEDTIESYTKKEIDKKYITRILELTYDQATEKVKARDITIPGMNQAEGEIHHGEPTFVKDKVTGTILYEHQGKDGYFDGKYISEKNPDILFDFDMVESHKGGSFDYAGYLGISGVESNLVPYQNKVVDEKAETQYNISDDNTDGGIINYAEQTDTSRKGRANSVIEKGDARALSEKSNGQGVSQKDGRDGRAIRQESLTGGKRGEIDFSPSEIIIPRKGSVVESEGKILDEYGIEWYAVRKESWHGKTFAYIHSGVAYMRADIAEKYRGGVARHEATHAMRQFKYEPYLDFLDRTPDMLNLSTENARVLMERMAKHREMDLLDTKNDTTEDVFDEIDGIYDEINAAVYGDQFRSDMDDDVREYLRNAFYDYDAYINELSAIHEQFKAERKVQGNEESTKSQRRSTEMEATLSDEWKSPTEENVGKSRFEKADIKLGDKIKDTFTTTADKLYIDTIDELYGVEKYLKTRGKMKNADAFTQSVRAAETMAQTMIGVAQYDITDPSGKKLGDGLTKIFKKYHLRKIEGKFSDYLLHQLNVDRMTLEERSLAKQEELRKAFETAEAAYHRAKRLVDEGKRKTVPKDVWTTYQKAKSAYENYEVLKNKPVFGANEERAADITAEESRKIIAEFEKRYPDFKETAELVWAYARNLQAMRVSAGLLSQESADIMAEYYPHYVPSFRDKNGGVGSGTVKNDSQLAVNSTVKSAKGGSEDVYDVEESLAVQTRQTIKAIKMNQLANAVYDSAVASGDTKYVLTAEAAERIENAGDDAAIDIDIELTPKNNQIVFYRDGKKVAMNVSEEIFKGFKGVTEGSVPDSPLLKLTSKVLGGFKNLVTQWSPAFAARNFVRDMQDAIINTKHPGKFATHIKDAIVGMATNDSDWQNYLAYGGFASTVFDAKGFQNEVDARGFEELKKISGINAKDFKSMAIPLQNLLKFIGNANSFIEQLTRFTEYKASIAAGDSIEVAINNSAEVTTNFSRHGSTVKKLNATIIPFLNASVQGFDKMLRVISGPFKEKSLTALAILLAKIVAIGITPQILNMIMNGDDEDYNDLTDEVKSNYFLIKVGDQFIKIPRGRLAGAFGGFVNQMRNVSRGEGFDAKGYTESIVTNLTPVDSFSRDIFSPFRDVKTNTTWYGGEIEGRQFEGIRPGQRYDESTSSIAIAIGGAINYSPKKIHYLLDQYSGVIGDFLLPATTKKAEKDYFSGNFLLDPKTNNKLSDQFYKLYDEAQYAKNEGDITAYYQLKHLNDVKESVSELYDEITEIQRSDLSNTEKLQQVRVIRTLINNLYKTAKADYGAYTQAIEATAGMFDESDASQQKLRHTVITQMMYGSEKALEEYNSAVYEKAALANKAGISYDLYYEYYFTTKDIESDYDRKGEVISGSKKEKTLKAIKALGVSANERLLLTALSGYSLTDAEKRRLLSIITRMNGTKEEKAALAEKCGFKVKNGRISMK